MCSRRLLVPRLCLGTRCLRGSASRVAGHDASPTSHRRAGGACKAGRTQAEPGYENRTLPPGTFPSAEGLRLPELVSQVCQYAGLTELPSCDNNSLPSNQSPPIAFLTIEGVLSERPGAFRLQQPGARA